MSPKRLSYVRVLQSTPQLFVAQDYILNSARQKQSKNEVSITGKSTDLKPTFKQQKNSIITPKVEGNQSKQYAKLIKQETIESKNSIDIKLLNLQELTKKVQDKARFLIEQLMFVPSKHLIHIINKDRISDWVSKKRASKVQLKVKSSNILPVPAAPKPIQLKEDQSKSNKNEKEFSKLIEVDSIGLSTADQPITGYDAYLNNRGEEATLILEPQSRAIAGNGGTAISAPVSRAILRKGSGTKVLFKPQSVAIAGVKGKAHASADLIIDYIE